MKHIDLFLELAEPNQQGVSKKIYATDFVGKYSKLRSGNGYKWPEGLLGKYKFERGGRGDDWWIKLTGHCNNEFNRGIRQDIVSLILQRVCEHTGYNNLTSDKLEVDHRNGRYNDPKVLSEESQSLDDFMCLSRRANLQKRSDCKNCKKTGRRFDARLLGYPLGWTSGNEIHNGTPEGCEGCYWFGPIKFRENLFNDNIR